MNILVTGHLGYIGAILTPMLRAAGHHVVGLDIDYYHRCSFAAAGTVDTVQNIRKDIRNLEANDIVGFDAVLHLAALSNDPLGDLRPEITFEINHRASVRLAELARDAGVSRFVFASSCSNYGAAGEDILDESAEFNPVTPYGHSKVMTERDLLQMATDNFSPALLRCATAYGVSPRMRFDLVLNNLVAWAFTTGRVHLKSDGTPWRPIVHIEDISRAYLAVLHAPRELIHNQAFNVGRTDENYQVRDIAHLVSEVVPHCEVEVADGAGADQRSYRVNCDKLAATLPEFVPVWDARRGAEELLATYRRASLTLEAFEGPRYKRIAQIQAQLTSGHLDENLRYARDREAAA